MIVVAGEALIDLVPREPGDPLSPLTPARGGGPYNTAVALARLGSPVAFCSRVSTDAFGASLVERLEAEGVDTGPVQRGPEPTSLAAVLPGPDGSADYAFYTEGTADRLFALPGPLPAGARALSLGTCSLVLEPGASAYRELLRREAGRGVFIALDPNVRPQLIADPGGHRSRLLGLLPHTSLLKLSEEDALWIAAGEPGGEPAGGSGGGSAGDPLEAAARRWLAAGPEAVVVTRGGDGISVWTRRAACSVPGVPVGVVDTVGAGDTVNAALLHALDRRGLLVRGGPAGLGERDWHEVLSFAARAAAATCSRAGAEPPYADELSPAAAG
ncbi:carbohydrate kinase family protein [Nocardiopsis composta]|uniref:Fructokinase n=1 Tax=Nocardiopsis composta TaxID=157465 RepID=A0A7W8QIG2_9ACTN|nr:carbohydrate kinase [Nocardiopsis composta]MBB5431102.1 fructokinase [Nocardiopsis composta]